MKNPFEIEKENKTLDIQFREPCYTCDDIDAQTNFVFYRTYVTIYCGHQNVCAKYLENKAKEEASNFQGYCEHDAEITVEAFNQFQKEEKQKETCENAKEDFEKMKKIIELGEPAAIAYHRSFPNRIYVEYPVNIEKIELAIKNFDGKYPSSQKVARNIDDDSIIIVNVDPYYRVVYERGNDDNGQATWIKKPLFPSPVINVSRGGYRLIHPEPETYTVQINGKDVVLQKGEDYVVIPKKEIFYL